jgi:hypothetical protein
MNNESMVAINILLSNAINSLNALKSILFGPVNTCGDRAPMPSPDQMMEKLLKSIDLSSTPQGNTVEVNKAGCKGPVEQSLPRKEAVRSKVSVKALSGKIPSVLPPDGSPMQLKKIVEILHRNGDLTVIDQKSSNYVSMALTTLKKANVIEKAGPGNRTGWRLIIKEGAAADEKACGE